MSGRWHAFWFEPAPAQGLGAFRIVLYAALLANTFRADLSAWGAVDPLFWDPPPAIAALGLGPPSPRALAVLQACFRAALALSCLGALTRPSSLAAFLLGFAALAIPNCYGVVGHTEGAVVLVLGILAAARPGDALSVDAALRRRRGAPAAAPSGEYRWPIVAARAAVALVFFASAVAKLRASGLGWVLSDDLAYIFGTRTYYSRPSPFGLNHVLAAHPLLCRALGAGTLAIELGYPFALFSRRAAAVLVPASVAMLAGFWGPPRSRLPRDRAPERVLAALVSPPAPPAGVVRRRIRCYH